MIRTERVADSRVVLRSGSRFGGASRRYCSILSRVRNPSTASAKFWFPSARIVSLADSRMAMFLASSISWKTPSPSFVSARFARHMR